MTVGKGADLYPFDYGGRTGSGLQLASIPVEDADTISIRFTEPVDDQLFGGGSIGGALTLVSENLGTNYGLSFQGLGRNGSVATWTITNTGGLDNADAVTLTLADTVRDLQGIRLDGDWVNPTDVNAPPDSGASKLRSGDGSAGGAFVFEFNSYLEGDFNNNGLVEQGDLDLVLMNWGVDTAVEGVPDGWLNTSDLAGLVEQTELDAVLTNWGDAGPVHGVSGGGGGAASSPAHPVFYDLDFLQGLSGSLTFTAGAAGDPDVWLWDSPWYSGYFEYDEANDTYILHQSSVQTEADGNAYLAFAEHGDRTFAVIPNSTPSTGAETWDISFDYSIPQSDGNSTVRIWALAEGESVGYDVEDGAPSSPWLNDGSIDATLLHTTALVDVNGWTTVNINDLLIPAGYGAIVIEWSTHATSGGGILGIDNLLVEVD